MITIDQPAMGLNSTWNHHIHVQMWNTWDVAASATPEHIIGWVRQVALGAPGGKLKNVVFSCHGQPGSIGIGQGLNCSHLGLFSQWTQDGAPLVEKIWFRCCEVARIPTTGAGACGPAGGGDGNLFCSGVAKAAKCYVVASTELQVGTVGRVLPFGKLDTFEGLVLSYGPGGNVTWSHRYPSTYQYADGNWYQNPD
jgi:hypothetical protein